MLAPLYYESCTEAILAQYARLEDAILSAMVRRILKMGFVSDSTKHQAEMLQEAGLLYDDILQIIADQTNATVEQVKALFEDAGVRTVEIDNEVYREAGMAPVDIRQSDSMRQTLEAGFRKTLGVMNNLTSTTALTTQRAFYRACNDAYMQITSGAFSYQEAIRNVLKQAAQGGLAVEYPSGHTDKLDVAIRRAALTGVGQTAAEIGKMNAEANGCYLMVISAHSGARPTHAKWQGQLATLTGKDAGKVMDGMKVFTLSEIGYGSGDGFRGWNCRHDWYPYFPGLSTPNYSKKELEDLNAKNIEWNGKKYTEYEISQMQRAQERKIRELKRQTVKMQDAADFTENPELKAAAQADYQAMAAKLKAAEKDLQTFCKTTGQDRDRFREQVLGFSRSEAQRAVQAAKKAANAKSIPKKNSIKPAEKSEKVLTLEQNNDIIRDERIVEAITSGKISLTLNPEKQNPHILNAPGYDPTKNKSYFTISLEELQGIVDEKYGTGEITIGKNGVANAKEYITMPYDIGECISQNGENLGKTNRFRVHYSKNRTHAVPTKRKEKDDGFI